MDFIGALFQMALEIIIPRNLNRGMQSFRMELFLVLHSCLEIYHILCYYFCTSNKGIFEFPILAVLKVAACLHWQKGYSLL